MDTLVLTIGYEPLERVCWTDAIKKIIRGAAEILESYEQIVWQGMVSVGGKVWDTIKKPAVIRLLEYHHVRRGLRFSRKNIYLRDDGKCQFCEKSLSPGTSTIDHVVPMSKGGKTTWTNVVLACVSCNQKKGAKSVQEAGMKLLKKPVRPESLPYSDKKRTIIGRGRSIPEEWNAYIYWNVPLEEEGGE